jgi:Glycosyl transferase family 2
MAIGPGTQRWIEADLGQTQPDCPMISRPTVSVVMAVRNGEKYVAEAIESILAQTYRSFEFIIIDDGSSDGTPGILQSYQQQDDRIRVYTQENRGHAASLNRGCQLALGKYLARMDADDVSVRHRLEAQVEYLESNPQVAVVGGAVHCIDSDGKFIETRSVPEHPDEIRQALVTRNPICHSMVMMRRDVFQQVGGYRIAFEDAEDYDLWIRISEHHDLANLSFPLGCYRISSSQISHRSATHQVAACLAAQLSATERHTTGRDSFEDIESVWPVLLSDSKRRQTLEGRCAQVLLERAYVLLPAEGPEIALETLQAARKHLRLTDASGLHQQARKVQARIYFAQGRRPRSILLYAGCAWHEPALLWRCVRLGCRWFVKRWTSQKCRLHVGLGSRSNADGFTMDADSEAV